MVSVAMIGSGDAGQTIAPLSFLAIGTHTANGSFQENFQASMDPSLSAKSDLGPDGVVDVVARTTTVIRNDFGDKPAVMGQAVDKQKPDDAEDGNGAKTRAKLVERNEAGGISKMATNPDVVPVSQTPEDNSTRISQTGSSPDIGHTEVLSRNLNGYAGETPRSNKSQHDPRPTRTKLETKVHKTQEVDSTVCSSSPAGTFILSDADAPTISPIAQPTVPSVLGIIVPDSNESSGESRLAITPNGAVLDREQMVRASKKAPNLKGPIFTEEGIAGNEDVPGVHVQNVSWHAKTQESIKAAQHSGDVMSPLLHDRTKPSHGPPAEISGVAPLSLLKDQSHHVEESSADRRLSTSRHGFFVTEYGEPGPVDIPAMSASEHRVVAAMPTMLEVAIPSGSHGWLRVRAELAGDGAVHASVSTTSAAGEEMLRRELPALARYLDQEQVSVGSLFVHASANSSSMASERDHGGAGYQQHQDGQTDRRKQEATSFHGGNGALEAKGLGEGSGGWIPQVANAGNGGWLSIRA